MTLFSFRWDNLYLPNEGGEELYMNLFIDQTHTEEKIRFIVPLRVIDEMLRRDFTPGNEDWWTLRLDLKAILT